MIKISIEQLELMPYPAPWGGGRWSYNKIPFTGISYEYFSGTQILNNESEHVDGYIEGRQTEYFSNGLKKVEYYKRNDYIYKYLKKWEEVI